MDLTLEQLFDIISFDEFYSFLGIDSICNPGDIDELVLDHSTGFCIGFHHSHPSKDSTGSPSARFHPSRAMVLLQKW